MNEKVKAKVCANYSHHTVYVVIENPWIFTEVDYVAFPRYDQYNRERMEKMIETAQIVCDRIMADQRQDLTEAVVKKIYNREKEFCDVCSL